MLYRVDVGRSDGVTPKDIVGAIANEGGIPGKSIGYIKLNDEFCTVVLPRDIDPQAIKRLGKIRIVGKPANFRPWSDDSSAAHDAPPAPRRKPKGPPIKKRSRPE